VSGRGLTAVTYLLSALTAALTTGWLPRVRRQARAVIVAVCVRGAAIVAFGQFLAGPKPGTDSAGRRPLNGPRRCAAAVGAPYRQPSASSCTVLG
jgi:hypothetical protein